MNVCMYQYKFNPKIDTIKWKLSILVLGRWQKLPRMEPLHRLHHQSAEKGVCNSIFNTTYWDKKIDEQVRRISTSTNLLTSTQLAHLHQWHHFLFCRLYFSYNFSKIRKQEKFAYTYNLINRKKYKLPNRVVLVLVSVFKKDDKQLDYLSLTRCQWPCVIHVL